MSDVRRPDGRRPDALVVGGGIVGAACAWYLARDGQRVTVLDAGFPGGGSTAAAMGHVVVMDDSEAQFALTALSVRLWTELASELPAACEDECRGTIWVAADEEELEHARVKQAFYVERGVEAEVLTPADLMAAEPELRPGLAGALFVPGDRIVYPPGAARWLMDQAVDLGAEVRADTRVEAIGPGWATAAGNRIEAGLVVNAAGAEAAGLTPGLPIEPRKGHLAITDRYPGFCGSQLVELGYLKSAHSHDGESVAFNLQPRATGQLLIGSSRELVGFDASLHRRILGAMLERAAEFLPRLPELSVIRTWTGFRPASKDHLPFIGPWQDSERLWIAAGHEGLGITLSLGTGKLLADRIAGREPTVDPAPYDPGRLAAGALS